MATEGKGARERQVAGVPRADIVLADVGTGVIAFARVDEAVVQLPTTPAEGDDGRTAVPRDIGYLPTIVAVGGIGEVLGLLIGVGEACRGGDGTQ